MAEQRGGGAWPGWLRVGFRFCFAYFVMFALGCANVTVWEAVPGAGYWLEGKAAAPFTRAAAWVARHWMHLSGPAATPHGSGFGDKTLDWVSAGLMLVLAIVATVVWTVVDERRGRREYRTLAVWLRYGLRWAVIAAMFVYGAMKVAPIQIGAPSLAVLHEPVGSMSRMTLLWTVLGLSPLYERLCGWLEMTAAVLLLFRRTALAGCLVSVVIMANVVLFDAFFDIPVKLYSVNLLLMIFVVMAPDVPALLRFFVRGRMATAGATEWTPRFGRAWVRYAALGCEALLVFTLGVHRPLVRERQWRTESAMMRAPSPWAGIWEVDAAASTMMPAMKTMQGSPLEDVVLEPNGRITLRAADGTQWGGLSYRRDDPQMVLLLPPAFVVSVRVEDFDGQRMRMVGEHGALVLHRVPTPKSYVLLDGPYHFTNEYGEDQ